MSRNLPKPNHKDQLLAAQRIARTLVSLFLRLFEGLGVLFTVWVIIGSIWTPYWWYPAISNGGLLDRQYLDFGWSSLIDNERGLLLLVIALVATLGLCIYRWRAKFISILDRIRVPAIIVCTALLMFDALLLHQPRYENGKIWMQLQSGIVTPSMLEYRLAHLEPRVSPPVTFYYLDAVRINEIYSEIEPSLIETQRTVTVGNQKSGSAEIGGEAATLRAEIAKRNQETSRYVRSNISSERKCLQVINFSLDNGSAHYFTSMLDFYARTLLEQAYSVGKLHVENQGPNEPVKVDARVLSDNSPKLSASDLRASWNEEFRREARGFVLVDGVFLIKRVKGTILFEEEFSQAPLQQRVVFRFSLPEKFDSDLLRNGYRMRVFGDVMQNSKDPAEITIDPVAILNE